MTAPDPSDIDGPAGESGDLIERDGLRYWKAKAEMAEARLAALQQEHKTFADYAAEIEDKLDASEALAASLQRRVEAAIKFLHRYVSNSAQGRETLIAIIESTRAALTPPERGGKP